MSQTHGSNVRLSALRSLSLLLLIAGTAYGQLRIPSAIITDKLADTTWLYKSSVRTDTILVYKRLKAGVWMVDSASGRDSGYFARRDSARMLDLRLTAPSMIYLLSHNSFADYATNRHIDWTAAEDDNFSLVGGETNQFYINSRGSLSAIFSVDCQNDRVGVGTNAPRKLLHVAGTGLIDSTLILGGGYNRVIGDAQTTTSSYRTTARYEATTDTSIIGEYDIPASGDTCAITFTAKITGVCDSSGTYLGDMVSCVYNGSYHKMASTVYIDTLRQYYYDRNGRYHISVVQGTDGPRLRGYMLYDSGRKSRVRWTAVFEANENMVNQ